MFNDNSVVVQQNPKPYSIFTKFLPVGCFQCLMMSALIDVAALYPWILYCKNKESSDLSF